VRFLLDHDVPAEIERLLVGRGHEVATVRGSMSETAADDEVFNAAQTGNQILVTCNRDDFLALAKEQELHVTTPSPGGRRRPRPLQRPGGVVPMAEVRGRSAVLSYMEGYPTGCWFRTTCLPRVSRGPPKLGKRRRK